ncbi:MAG: HEPN domain-containing protein [Dehalococcoidia bacterium]
MTEPLSADAQAWLESALRDSGWARHDFAGGYYAQACFACQQVFEKMLKALLLAHGVPYPKTHELVRLVALCAGLDERVGALEEDARNVDGYYVSTRYPDLASEHEYTKEEAEEALRVVDGMLNALRPIIEESLREEMS